MDYLLGALAMAAFLFCMYGAYKAGQRSRRPVQQREVDEEQVRRSQRIRQDFERMMSYNESTALGKKVT